MKPILYVRASLINDVRLDKFLNFFKKKGIPIFYWGWNRNSTNNVEDETVTYILKGGGFSNNKLLLFYPIWVWKVFFKMLFLKNPKQYNLIAINFESGLPIYLVSKLRNFKYIYEVYDEFALSHNFPKVLKKFIIYLDRKVMKNASTVIHVDNNRLTYKNCNNLVIENSPYDHYQGTVKDYSKITHTFAVIGYLTLRRGISEIYKFVEANPNVNFIVIGSFHDNNYKEKFEACANVRVLEKMPQKDLFSVIENCCGIFSLYDAIVEINRLAASNKVYDAMMLGVPVITNPEVINSSFIKEQNIGVLVNYYFDDSWSILSNPNFVNEAVEIGKNGRKLYLDRYIFEDIVEKKLLPIIN